MTFSLLLGIAIVVLCLVTVWVIVVILAHPRARELDPVKMRTRHGREILDGTAARAPSTLGREDYSDLFEQFERAVIEAEYSFERRQTAQELRGKIKAADQSSLISSEGWVDVDTITRTELLALRSPRPDWPTGDRKAG